MKNLIITASNYTDIGGKRYGVDDMGCNYPVTLDIFKANVTFTQGETLITTDGDFFTLLGGSIQNNNEPLYKWICDTGSNGVILELSHILTSTTAILKTPAAMPNDTYEFGVIDYFGQPAVEQTYLIDVSSAGAINQVALYTKTGVVTFDVQAYQPYPIGSEPALFNVAVAPTAAFNIQYI